jgi:hypothetical protein
MAIEHFAYHGSPANAVAAVIRATASWFRSEVSRIKASVGG